MYSVVSNYLDRINHRYQTGISREHSYRGDLQNLLESMIPDVLVTNEPARISCGAPDYILTRKNIPVGYIEAKDIGADLNSKLYREQIDRYRRSLDNLTVTDYLQFYFYREGDLVSSIAIAEPQQKSIKPLPGAFDHFNALISDFVTTTGQTITSSKKLAKLMAGKARLMANIIEAALNNDDVSVESTALREQMAAFRDILIHDISNKDFADIYAQTIAYGMFAARLHDPTLSDFSRYEAGGLIPKSNPFLRRLFQYIAGHDLDERINWTVDALADIFRATDVQRLLKDFGKATQQNDPMIHFYETFLSEYDPKLRKSRGVWYTPEPVVNFMVRAVDDILKYDFNLKDGLASIDKTRVKVNTQNTDKRTSTGYRSEEREVHKVQILDPATGTGTFLAQIVKQIYSTRFNGMQGIWSKYVEDHLIPRLNGFEILMASYAMAHLKLDMLLSETGYIPTTNQRLRIYLTNSLEEHHPDTGTLFANWLSSEANEANHIKRDTPVMCIIGNPPYSGESSNKGKWIMKLMEDYKKEPGGKEKLKERNSKFINDDYVKFLRYGQYFIEKKGSGILAFINPHGFLDNPTFRGMRYNLLKTYDKIYTIDLHGNAKKKETAPDGSLDANVFDIEQGVSINFFVKTGNKKANELGQVLHCDLFGKRESKYNFLLDCTLKNVPYKEVIYTPPYFFFMPKDFEEKKNYEQGFCLTELFKEKSLGVLSKNDDITVEFDRTALQSRIDNFRRLSIEDLRRLYNIKSDSRDWVLSKAKDDLIQNNSENNFKNICYRPFDNRWTYFTGTPKGFFAYSQNRIMKHMRNGRNLAIITGRQGQAVGNMPWNLSFITNTISDQNIYYRGGGTVLPLYLYSETNCQTTFGKAEERVPNLDKQIVEKIACGLQLDFVSEKQERANTLSPIDILDYIYAILHSPTYREKYKEFLKIDFPRIPYPDKRYVFWQLVSAGGELRKIHLFQSHILDNYITQFPQPGDNVVMKPTYKNGNVYINDAQYFNSIPEITWNFYIGGYQPVQKWLKDRKGRTLEFTDIMHYQKIIVAITETIRLMREIDKLITLP